MLEYIVLLGVVALITLALFCLTEAGTKETSFEEALAEQRLLHKDGSNAKNKKPKTTKKVRPSRPRASQATEGGAPTRSTSTGHDSPGTTTEDENHEELLLAEQRRHQELKRQQAEQARQQAEQARLQAEEQRRQAELQEQQRKLEEAAQLEKQKQLQLEQQEQLKKQQVEQQLKEMAEQEAKKNEKKKKQMKPDDSKAKQTRPSKATGLMNGVHTEASLEAVTSNGMTADVGSLRANGKKATSVETEKPPVRRSSAAGGKQESASSRDQSTEKIISDVAVKKNRKNLQASNKTSVQTILRTVEEAQLSSEQLQQVVDSLLAAAADGCWSDARKGASVSINKKLDDANATIALMQEAQSALTVKISDLRTELNSERSKSVQLRRALDAANAEQQLQLQRHQDLQLQHKQQLQQQVLQEVQEERARLQQEYKDKIRQMEASNAESARAAREGAAQHMQQQEHAALHRLQELQAELAAAKAQVQQSQYTAEQLSRSTAELESRVSAGQQERQQLSAALEERDIVMQHLQQEKEEALMKLAAESKKLQDQAVLQDTISSQTLERERQRAESLAEQLHRLQSELQSRDSELQTCRAKNDELRDKNSAVLKAYKEREADLEARDQRVAQSTAAVHSYTQLLCRLHPTVSVPPSLEGSAWQEEFERQVQAEVQKVQKEQEEQEVEVVEVIVEKEVQDPALLATLQRLQEDHKCLQQKASGLEKQVAELQKSLEDNKRLQADNKNLTENKKQHEDNKKILEENKLLQERVLHYQSVLDSTETLLQSLQASVEGEEAKWMSVVKEKDDAILQISKENDRLGRLVADLHPADQQQELQRVKEEKEQLLQELAALRQKAGEVASLRALVAEGVDAGRQQEQLIEQLQAALHAKVSGSSSSSSNGPPSADTASDESEGKQ